MLKAAEVAAWIRVAAQRYLAVIDAALTAVIGAGPWSRPAPGPREGSVLDRELLRRVSRLLDR